MREERQRPVDASGHTRASTTSGATTCRLLWPAVAAPFMRKRKGAGGSGAFQHHDGNLALSSLLVRVVVGPLRNHPLPKIRFLLGARGPGPGSEPVALHLHLDVRVVRKVEIPGRGAVGAALRGHNRVGASLSRINQRRRPLLTRFAPFGGQEQGLGSLPVMTLFAVGGAVARDMFLAKERHAGSTLLPLRDSHPDDRQRDAAWTRSESAALGSDRCRVARGTAAKSG